MDLQKFRETYKQVITESTNDSELKNYIRSIVEEVINEENKMIVTKVNFPKLFKAIDILRGETGLRPMKEYNIKSSYTFEKDGRKQSISIIDGDLTKINVFLDSLGIDDYHDFIDGDSEFIIENIGNGMMTTTLMKYFLKYENRKIRRESITEKDTQEYKDVAIKANDLLEGIQEELDKLSTAFKKPEDIIQ